MAVNVYNLGSGSTRLVQIGTVTFLPRIGLAFPRDRLEWFHMRPPIGSNWSASEIGPNWNRTRGNGWFQMGLDGE